jgi:DNA-binding transcriptional ArsR family regulator
MRKLVAQYALSKRKPEELRELLKRAYLDHPILNDPVELTRRARLFLGVGHEVRLKILGLLELEELCFCNIIEALELPASNVAHHLSMLEEAGLVVRRENGKFTSFTLRKDLITKHHILQK